jgi:UDP-2,3-diacylglucosamine pyrophosphatase LpxH
LDCAYKECVNANARYGVDMRLVVIGHTHHACIAVQRREDGQPFMLVDCGAWIEECREEEGAEPKPNA